MRASNRTAILDAAIRVVERSGITAVTLESVAAEAGLTKGGLMYHFPTRDALLGGIQRHLAELWEGQLEEQLEVPLGEATEQDRLVAYARISTQAASRAELMLLLESGFTEQSTPWREVLDRWTTAPNVDDPTRIELTIARLAADGLWMQETLGGTPIDEPTRAAITEHLVRMVRESGGAG